VKGEPKRCRIEVRVQAGARKDEVSGKPGETVKVRVRAPAVEGAANRGVIELLAQTLGVRRSQLRILRGKHHRDKIIEIDGMAEDELWERLDGRA